MRTSLIDIASSIVATCSTIILYKGDVQTATYFILVAIFVRLLER